MSNNVLSASPTKAPDPAIDPVEAARKRRADRRRKLVMCLLVLGCVCAGALAVSWLAYRFNHTVIANASVKGRLHRMGARIEGQVAELRVIPGQKINKGDVLIRLEDGYLKAAVRRGQSELESATKRRDTEKLAIEQQRRQLTLEVERSETLLQADVADLDAAKSSLERLEREFERTGTLKASGVASGSENDKIRADRDNARAHVISSEANLLVAKVNCRAAKIALEGLKVREAGLEVLNADVEQSRQRLAAAEEDLAATVIRAPEDGWAAERIVEEGGSAKVGEPILLAWLGEPWVEAWADEKQLKTIGMGSSVDVTLTAFPGQKLKGRVEGIGVLTDKEFDPSPVPSTLYSLFPKNAKVPIRIDVTARHLRLQPGLTAVVGIKDSKDSYHTTTALSGFLAPSALPSRSVAQSN